MTTDPSTITLIETNEVNQPTATYIYTESGKPRDGTNTGRIDLIPSTTPSSSWSRANLVNTLADVFLPAGYPHSVSEDYLPYQIFDSLQAFSSSIAGLLASRAVLQGVGVGNPTATPTTALLLHILQDTTGRLATILFAHRIGTALEPECKRYRLAADVFNDLAMILDCLSPLVPTGFGRRVGVLSSAGVLRALCGVAGGSSKASLSAHFARGGNLAEVNAKDSSQETIVSLIGMLAGSLVVTYITSLPATWISLLLLLSLHLSLNYAAVRSVQMTSLNRQRANIVFSTLLESDCAVSSLPSGVQEPEPGLQGGEKEEWKILTPAQVAKQERIFERDGILKWQHSNPNSSPTPTPAAEVLGYGSIGISIHQFLTTTTNANPQSILPALSSLFTTETYLLHLSHSHNHASGNSWGANIVLKQSSTARSQLKAWMHALLALRAFSSSKDGDGKVASGKEVIRVLKQTLNFLNQEDRFEKYAVALEGRGWELDIAALETRSGRRVSLV